MPNNLRLLTLSADVGRALTDGSPLPAALQQCAEALVRNLDAAFARIWSVNEAGDTLELRASAGMYTHLDGPHGRVPVGQFKIGLIAQERLPHLTNAVVGDPRVGDQAWAVREGMVAFAGHPLIVGDKLIGVMALFARHALNDTTLDALAAVANQVAVGIDSAHLFQQAQQEIAARERAQNALRASEQQLRLVIDASPILISYVDQEHRYRFNNRAYADWLKQSPEQINGKHVAEVIGEAAYQQVKAQIEAALAGQTVTYDREMNYQGLEPRYVHSEFVPDRGENGEIKGFVAAVSDITANKRQLDEQKRAAARERFLGELGERMRATSDQEEIMWAAVSAVGDYLQTSRCYYADTNVKAGITTIHRDYCRGVESWAGTYSLSSFGADVIAELQAGKTVVVNDTAADPRTVAHYEITYVPVHIRAYIAVPLIEEGVHTASFVVSDAFAPRAWTQEEAEIMEIVAERTRLAVANARLWQAERERSEQLTMAISEVHHRVKNSLQGVSALLEMQIPFDGDTLPVETVRESLNQIKTIALVHDLLARDQPIGKVDAGRVLTNLVELLAAGMKTAERSTPIYVKTEEAWIPTKAATALALVVNELVSNADKHSRSHPRQRDPAFIPNSKADFNENQERTHSGDLPSHDAIEVSLTRHEANVHVIVQDRGPGFAPDFDPVLHANIGLELALTLVQHDLHGSIAFSNRPAEAENPAEFAAAYASGGGRVEIVFAEDLVSE